MILTALSDFQKKKGPSQPCLTIKRAKVPHGASERYTLDNPRLSERSESSLGRDDSRVITQCLGEVQTRSVKHV